MGVEFFCERYTLASGKCPCAAQCSGCAREVAAANTRLELEPWLDTMPERQPGEDDE